MRTVIRHLRSLALALAACTVIAIGALTASVMIAALTPAHAQVSAEFQSALEPYGSWQPHPRFGEVWVPTICRLDGVPTRTDDGSTPKSGAGTGSPMRKRPTGVGWPSTMAVGRTTGGSAGSGFRVMNGVRPGSIGAGVMTMSAGRRCRLMRSSTNMTMIRPTGFSCRRAIWCAAGSDVLPAAPAYGGRFQADGDRQPHGATRASRPPRTLRSQSGHCSRHCCRCFTPAGTGLPCATPRPGEHARGRRCRAGAATGSKPHRAAASAWPAASGRA